MPTPPTAHLPPPPPQPGASTSAKSRRDDNAMVHFMWWGGFFLGPLATVIGWTLRGEHAVMEMKRHAIAAGVLWTALFFSWSVLTLVAIQEARFDLLLRWVGPVVWVTLGSCVTGSVTARNAARKRLYRGN